MAGIPLFIMLASAPNDLSMLSRGQFSSIARQLFFILAPALLLYHLQTSRAMAAYFAKSDAAPPLSLDRDEP